MLFENFTKPKNSKAFTLIELLVVISIIAMLLAILMPALGKVKEKAQTVVCASNLKQWNLILKFFANDNDGKFPDANWDDAGGGDAHGQWWIQPLLPYSENPEILVCAKARRKSEGVTGDTYYPTNADECWGSRNKEPSPEAGEMTWASYAPNAWIMDPSEGTWGAVSEGLFWASLDSISTPVRVPLFLDSRWVDAWPHHTDVPNSKEYKSSDGQGYMRQFTIRRHGAAVNAVFADGSARKVDLTDLWKQKWHKGFDTHNTYSSSDAPWPDWMK